MKKKWLIFAPLAMCCIGFSVAAIFADAQTTNNDTANALKNIKGCTFEAGVDSPDETLYPSRGVKVTTSTDGVSSFAYNGIFDLESGEDFIRFLILPEDNGQVELEDLVIKLTDIYDESRYIKIDFDDANYINAPMNSYIRCNVSDRYKGIGHEWNGTLDTAFGTQHYTSWCGNTGVEDWQETVFYYDVEHKEIRTRIVHWTTNHGFTNEQDMLLCDLDIPELGVNAFEGFTTNEVYITVEVTSQTKKGHLLVSKIAGVDLSGKEIAETKPKITLDWMGYAEDAIPYGLAGEKNSYPVFPAKAYSPKDGIFVVDEISVKYGAQLIPVKNGRFETKEAGLYQICYSATSKKGTKALKTVEVEVKEARETPLTHTFDETIPSIAYEGMDRIYLPLGEVEGEYGTTEIVHTLFVNGEEVSIQKDGLAEYFVPQVLSGDYTIYVLRSTVVDVTGNPIIFEKEIKVCTATAPVIEGVSMPKAIRVGFATEFSIPLAYTLAQDGTKSMVPVTMKVNGEICTDGIYTPTQAGTLNVEFSAGATTEQYEVVALEPPTLENVNNYFFLTDNFTYAGITNKHVAFTKGNGNASLTFANALCIDAFSVMFNVTPNMVREIKLTLRDIKHYDQVVELFIRTGMNDMVMLYAGETLIGALGGSLTTDNGYITVEYNDAKGYFMAKGKVLGKIEYYKNGTPFAGFGGNGVYLDIELTDADAGAQLQISALNAQIFSDIIEDDKKPDISFETIMASAYSVPFGKSFTVYAAKAWDVLGDIDSMIVQVNAPDGQRIYNGPCDQDIQFVAEQYGTYNVTYVAMDSAGWTTRKYCNVQVVDIEKPTLNTSFVPNSTYKVGDVLEIPAFTANDDIDKSVETYAYVKTPSGQWKVLTKTSGEYNYTFLEAGTYRIGFAAVDDALNTAYIEYEVHVK